MAVNTKVDHDFITRLESLGWSAIDLDLNFGSNPRAYQNIIVLIAAEIVKFIMPTAWVPLSWPSC